MDPFEQPPKHPHPSTRGSLTAAIRIRKIAAFFGLHPAGQEMSLMTGIGPYRLSQLIEGHHEHLSLPVRRHLRVLADLAETSVQPGDEAEAAARAGWLLFPSIDTDFGRLRPLEYLADRRLAAEGGQALLRSG